MSLRKVFLASLIGACSAIPSNVQRPPDSTIQPRAICTPAAGGTSTKDDVPAIMSAITKCGNGGTIVIPSNTTYYLNSVLDFAGCSGCDFQVEGLLKFASDTDYWEGKTAMISVSKINGLKIRSLTGNGVIDGNGQNAYDRFAEDSSYDRPTLLYITGGSNIEVSGLRQKNPPNVFVSVKGGTTSALFNDLTLSATSKSNNPAKNTDGFDIGQSTYVTISNTKVTNDDDCVAFKPGANYVTVRDITCTGSHGLSVGSLGKSSDDTVKNIWVEGATMISSTKAAGIKTYPSGGDHGLSTVSNVTWTKVDVQGCEYAIQIQSCYGEDEDYCEDNPGDAVLTGITFDNFSGTTDDKYDPVTGNLNCGSEGTCDVKVINYKVTAPSGERKVLCANTPSSLGVTCSSGASG
ncbi:putative endo-xylogalacturonan hydrolase A [Aspergillus ambiguus]|uniref:putative extracellular exo-polygalacturonase n=1 Tax=Aspergillus ambiguus TaxID=176160 RepID=UPI003CCD1B37